MEKDAHTGTAVDDRENLVPECIEEKRAQGEADIDQELLPALRVE